MEGKLVIFDFRLRLFTAIAEIYSFRSRQSLGVLHVCTMRLRNGLEGEIGGSGRR